MQAFRVDELVEFLCGEPFWTAGGARVSCGQVADKTTMTEQEMTGQKNQQ